jgi:hypothetical protein
MHLWLFPLFFSPFFRLHAAGEAVFVVDTGGPFDMARTQSKFIALFLAVNKSSLHPEISSCQNESAIIS